jgi:metallophosphoesterase (TIGR03767 family)
MGSVLVVALGGFWLAACGGGGSSTPPVVRHPQGTTLEQSILPAEIETQTPSGGAYLTLGTFAGWKLETRTDLSPVFRERTTRRQALAAFVHFTDVHITDAQSPLRAPYLRRFAMGTSATGLDFANAYRNQDQLGPYVVEAMLQKVASLRGGPASGRAFDCAVSTGDDGDSKQLNELQAFIGLLDGAPIDPDYSGEGYIGVQDQYVPDVPPPPTPAPACFSMNPPSIYSMYWHPEPPPAGTPPDCWKQVIGFPEYPGLLQSATQSFTSTGIGMPWYSGYGNHDALLQGNFPLTAEQIAIFDVIATGPEMILDIPQSLTPIEFLECLSDPTPQCVTEILEQAPKRTVPAVAGRRVSTSQDFIEQHLASPPVPGPVGHGFTQENLATNTLYYTFELAPGVLGIMLDSNNPFGGADGSLDVAQVEWLQAQLIANTSKYYSPVGQVIETGNPDKLVVIFSHHNSETFDNIIGTTATEPRVVGFQLEQLLHFFPNVVLWVNGHTHYNRAFAHPDRNQRTGGFWEVNTASQVEFPQQARTIEIIDNNDGTLSIVAVLLNHDGVVKPDRTPPYDVLEIAGISREIGSNDFLLAQPPVNIGLPEDRNVELLVGKPF